MKKLLIPTILIVVFFSGCDRVEQATLVHKELSEVLCNNPNDCICTFVWFNGEIVFDNYIPVDADSLRIAHMADSAETILKNLKSLK